MREYIKYAFCGREGLRSYMKWSGLGLAVLMVIHMLIIYVFSYTGMSTPDSPEHLRVTNLYENIGALFAGLAFAYVLARIIPVAVNGGTSRVNLILGTGIIAIGYSAVTILMMNAACLVTGIVYGGFGLKLDTAALICIGDALRDKAVADPRVIFFDVCVSFYLLLGLYAAAIIFAAVKMKINTAAAFLASAGSCVLIYLFYLDEPLTVGFGNLGFLSMVGCTGHPLTDTIYNNEGIWYLEDALYPDPRMTGDVTDYSDCLMSVLSDCFIVFLIAFLIYALLMLRSSLTGRRKV